MKVEVGKKYRGLINGIVFTVTEKRKEDNHRGLEYYVLTFEDGRTLYHYKSFVEHLLIEEVK